MVRAPIIRGRLVWPEILFFYQSGYPIFFFSFPLEQAEHVAADAVALCHKDTVLTSPSVPQFGEFLKAPAVLLGI